MNKKEIMDKIRKYNDGTQAKLGHNSLCAYQTKSGNRCFIGCFIPDGHDGLKLAGTVDELLEEFPDLEDYMPFQNQDLLLSFQRLHDNGGDADIHVNAAKWLDEQGIK